MSTLQGRSLAETYKDLLQVSNSNIGVDGTIRYVEDGEGTASALSISTGKVGVGINDWTTNEVFNVQGDSHITGGLNVTGNILSNGGTVITTNNELAALGNVSIAQPTDGQILKYSGTTSQWTPSDDTVTSYWSPAGTNDIYRFTGNVGIGTTNPIAQLSIINDTHGIEIQPGLSSGLNRITNFDRTTNTYNKLAIDASEIDLRASGNSVVTISNNTFTVNPGSVNYDFHVKPDSGTGLFFDGSAGNVGIGTTNPLKLLHIAGTGHHIVIEDSNSSQETKYRGIYNNNQDLYMGRYDNTLNTFTSDMVIDKSGKVGIGTTSPAEELHILAPAQPYLKIEATDASESGVLLARQSMNTWRIINRPDQSDSLAIQGNGATIDQFVTITQTGRVGIGNTDPAVNLHIGTTTSDSQWIRLGTQYGDFSIGNGSHNTPPVKYFSIYDNDAAQHRLYLLDNGDIGFGTTSPSARLHAYSFDSDSDLRLERGDNGQIVRIDQNSIRTMGATPLTIFTNSTSTNGLHIASDGDIGFSTVNPIHALELFGKGKRFALTSDHPDGTRINHVELASDGAGHGYTIIYNDVGNPMARIHSTGTSYFNGGNVGIGTASPEVDLHIKSTSAHGQSTLKLQGGLTGGYTSAIIFTNSDQTDNGAIYYNADDNFMRFNTGGLGLATEQMRITSSGDVGIGTDTPDNMLHVSGTGHTKVLTEGGSNNAVGFQMAQNLLDPGDGSVSPQIWQLQTQAGTRNLQIRNATLNTFPLHIDGTTGNVGIGTTNPVHVLEVATPDGKYGHHVVAADGITSMGGLFSSASVDGGGLELYLKQPGVTKVRITSNSTRPTYFNAGNVGIGTTNPGYPLHVTTTGSGPATFATETSVSTNTGNSGAVSVATRYPDPGTGSIVQRALFFASHRTSSSVHFAPFIGIQSVGGNWWNLWVTDSGELRIANSAAYAGSTTAGSAVGAQTSDERFKNIEDGFEYGLSQVLQLKPIAYTQENNNVRKLGFGAQTTQNIIPETVFDTGACVDGYDIDPDDEMNQIPRSNDTRLGMEYVQLIPVLTKAIQEQQQIIEELKSQNQSLINRIETLENK